MAKGKKIDEKLIRKLGLHLERGGLARLDIDIDEDISFEELMGYIGQGRINISVLKYFEFGSYSYFSKKLIEDYEKDMDKDLHPPIHIILMQVATLECFLNDMFIHYARKAYGKEASRIAEGLLSGSLRSKIYRIVPILSRGEKTLDLDSKIINKLLNLIKTRNKLVHVAEFYQDDKPTYSKKKGERPFSHTITPKHCHEYQEALDEFIFAVWNGPITDPPWQHVIIKDAKPEDN